MGTWTKWNCCIGTNGGPDAHGGGSIDIDVRHRDLGRGLGFLTSNPAYL